MKVVKHSAVTFAAKTYLYDVFSHADGGCHSRSISGCAKHNKCSVNSASYGGRL
jgi:hypothetical protein